MLFFFSEKKASGRIAPHRRPNWGCTNMHSSVTLGYKVNSKILTSAVNDPATQVQLGTAEKPSLVDNAAPPREADVFSDEEDEDEDEAMQEDRQAIPPDK